MWKTKSLATRRKARCPEATIVSRSASQQMAGPVDSFIQFTPVGHDVSLKKPVIPSISSVLQSHSHCRCCGAIHGSIARRGVGRKTRQDNKLKNYKVGILKTTQQEGRQATPRRVCGTAVGRCPGEGSHSLAFVGAKQHNDTCFSADATNPIIVQHKLPRLACYDD